MKNFTFLALLFAVLCGHWSLNAGPAAPIGKRICSELLNTGKKGTLASRNSYQITTSSTFPTIVRSSKTKSRSSLFPRERSSLFSPNSQKVLRKYGFDEPNHETQKEATRKLKRLLRNYENNLKEVDQEQNSAPTHEKNLFEEYKEYAEIK